MEDAQVITRIAWCDEAARGLSRALEGPILGIVEAEVRAGVSMLWECRDGDHRAYCVTRVDFNPTEFVIVAFEGTGMHRFGPTFIEAAKVRGIPMRAHTVSPVVARLIRRFGFKESEFVLRRA